MKLLALLFFVLFSLSCTAQKSKAKPLAAKAPAKIAVSEQIPFFNMEFEIDGKKTNVLSSDYENHDGNITNETKGRQMIFFGAGNDKKNNNSFMVNGLLSAATAGTFNLGTSEGMYASLGVMNVPEFPHITLFSAKSGTVTITKMPAAGGWVEGTFIMQCEPMDDQYKQVNATITGSFKIKRQ